MSLLSIDADRDRPLLHAPGDLDDALRAGLAGLPPGAPVVILLHGYKYSPSSPAACPHELILSLNPDPRAARTVSWPRHLGFGPDIRDGGLCIAFGWEARGTIWRAWNTAGQAAVALACLVAGIRTMHPGPIDILAHSLGARVAFCAMRDLPVGSIGRVILMAAAEFQSVAKTALATPAGQGAEIVNITSRENDIFDRLIEVLLPGRVQNDRALGAGLGAEPGVTYPNWLDLQMDSAKSRAALAELGYRIPAPARRICHWSGYLRPGLFALYRDLIRDRQHLSLARLRQALPTEPAPRWSRLLPLNTFRRGVLPPAS